MRSTTSARRVYPWSSLTYRIRWWAFCSTPRVFLNTVSLLSRYICIPCPGGTRFGSKVEGYFHAIPTRAVSSSVQFQSRASLMGVTSLFAELDLRVSHRTGFIFFTTFNTCLLMIFCSCYCFIQRHKTRLTMHLILLRRTSYTKSTGTVGFEPTKTGRLTVCSHTTCGRANIKRGRKSCGKSLRLLLLGLTSSAFPPCSLTSTGVFFNSLSCIYK